MVYVIDVSNEWFSEAAFKLKMQSLHLFHFVIKIDILGLA